MQPLQCVSQHSLHHHLPSSPLPFLTTSVPHHFPKSPLPFVTTLCHSLFFCDVLLCRVKSHTTLHQGQFFSDVLLCRVKSHTTLHQGQFFSDVLLCSVKSHTTLHQVKIIRNSEVLLPNFLWLLETHLILWIMILLQRETCNLSPTDLLEGYQIATSNWTVSPLSLGFLGHLAISFGESAWIPEGAAWL